MRRIAIATVLLALALAPAGARADDPFPEPIEQLGLALSMDAPETFRPGNSFAVSGRLVAAFALTILVEVAVGLPNTPVEIVVDDVTTAQATTDTEGYYRVDLMFDASAATHTLQARAFDGTLARTVSDPVQVRRERTLLDLSVTPSSATVGVGATTRLHAIALDGNGREVDVSEEAVWSSSNTGVATVSNADGARGVVTGVAPGTATITATIDGLSATARVDVT